MPATADTDEIARPITEPLPPTRHTIVTAAEAQAWLPVGAVIADRNGGFPLTRVAPIEVFDGEWTGGRLEDPQRLRADTFRVLFVPAVPPRVLVVGDQVRNATEARSLPVPAIILDASRGAWQVWENEREVREWTNPGMIEGLRDEEMFDTRSTRSATDPGAGYTVAWLPPESDGAAG